MSENPLIVKCLSCGANSEYNIKEQSYCCHACGGKTSVVDSITNLANWRKKQQGEIKNQLRKLPHTFTHCPNCGADFFFKENEVTGKCPYCDTSMIRKEYDESDSFPESIIPFIITLDEAKKKLIDFLNHSGHSFREEAQIAKDNINKMQGFYLPYSIIRGPLNFNVDRAGTKRQFHFEIYVEKNFINGSKELDNIVLDAMEPYDWKEVVPFDFGFISGQSVKIRNIKEKELKKRAIEEVAIQIRTKIVDKMDSEAIEIHSDSANILSVPVLLPVYYYKVGDFTVVVNGQTGRVSMSNNHETHRIVNYSAWVVMFINIAILVGISINFCIQNNYYRFYYILFRSFIYSFLTPLWLPFLIMPKMTKIINEKYPIASDKCLAIRKPDLSISYKYGNNVIHEEIPEPFFWEKFDDSKVNLNIDVIKKSTFHILSAIALFGPVLIPLTLAIVASIYYKNIVTLTYLFNYDKFIFFVLVWYITFGSWFSAIFTISSKNQYDNILVTKHNGLYLHGNKIGFALMAIIILFFPISFGFGSLNIIEKGMKLAEKEAKLSKLSDANNAVKDLKLNKNKIIDVNSNNFITFFFDLQNRTYRINFFENNKLYYYLYSLNYDLNKRLYRSENKTIKGIIQLCKINVNYNSFEMIDLKTKESWNVIYNKNHIKIQKEQLSDKKTKYVLKLSSDNSSYILENSEGKILGKTISNNVENNIQVYKNDNKDDNLPKLAYILDNSKENKTENMLMASPLMLLIEDLPINLRYIMMLELSQME